MKTANAYRIVSANSAVGLCKEVNAWLADGWRLHGGPLTVPEPGLVGVVNFAQAMTRQPSLPAAHERFVRDAAEVCLTVMRDGTDPEAQAAAEELYDRAEKLLGHGIKDQTPQETAA